ncbi:helix-turn-helix transcriptional regulator [Actinoplanes sp. NPDC051851]|uniref:helix-turn-helix transcriptional regulator n=1 Tax=Actinoplanes sp. NPDC051851 TaxID=3154753 RepID=UPI0034338137
MLVPRSMLGLAPADLERLVCARVPGGQGAGAMLGSAAVAAAHHISVRRLHQLFRHEPLTVAAQIRHDRLERCRDDLAAGRGTVSAIAARWGFGDPAHFSRLFRAAYGCPPREYPVVARRSR